MPPEHGKKLSTTLLAAAIVTGLMAQPGFGFLVWLLALVQLFVIPWRLHRAVRVPDSRPLQVARVGIWLAALATILAVHALRSETSRRSADEFLAQIKAYSARRGRCAASIRELGLTQKELSARIGAWSYYACDHGKKTFFYRASFVYFAIYRYDFANRTWQYLPE